jgi:hypothetical protein
MAAKKRKDGGDDHDKPPGDDYGKQPGDREPHEEEHDAVRIHEAYLQHRLGGGEPASPDAYRRAREQFEKLPGAVRSTPTPPPVKEVANRSEPNADKPADEGDSE